MIATIIVCAIGVLATIVWVVRGPLCVFRQELIGALEGLAMALRGSEETHRRLIELEDAVDRLPAKWEDVQREAKSYYARATHHVRRARQELEERGLADAELDELSQRLQPVDDGGIESEGVPTVSQEMGDDAPSDFASGQIPFWLQSPAVQTMIRRSRGEG